MASNKRKKSKYPALKSGLNLKMRQDFIEPEYINGVVDEDGNYVIRPLNEEELRFLNNFYEETVITNFLHNPNLKRLSKEKENIVNGGQIPEMKEKIKELKEDAKKNTKEIEDLKEIIKLTKAQNIEENQDKINEINAEMEELKQDYLLYPEKEQHKQFYSANNARNRDIFTQCKAGHKLKEITTENARYIVNSNLKNTEEDIIDQLERDYYEKEEERLKKVIRQEKRLKAKKDDK